MSERQSDVQKKAYVPPAIHPVHVEPVAELLQDTAPCGTISDGCGTGGNPPLC